MNYQKAVDMVSAQNTIKLSAGAVVNALHNFPQLEIMSARQVLERANKIKRGTLHSVVYHKCESQKGLKDFHKLTRYAVQFTDYESMSVIKDLRAGGVAANNPAVCNEVCIPTEGGAMVLYYNTKTGKIKLRVPLNKGVQVSTVYMIGDTVVDKSTYYKEWEKRGYKVPSYTADTPQPFRSLDVENIVCLH